MADGTGSRRRLWVVGLVAALVGGLVGGLLVALVVPRGAAAVPAPAEAVCPAAAVADVGLPSVVTIAASAPGGGAGGTGSGEVIRPGGVILTNDHVIATASGGGALQVRYGDGRTVAATVLGRDPLTDLAVLKAADGAAAVPVIALGSSRALVVGQPVVALGAPLGLYGTVTGGIISALDRHVALPVPKGSRRHFASYSAAVAVPGADEGRRQLANGKLAYLTQILVDQTLLGGGRGVLQDHYAAPATLDAIERERITHLFLVEPQLFDLMDEPAVAQHDLSSLRAVTHIGAMAAPVLRRRVRQPRGPAVAATLRLVHVDRMPLTEQGKPDRAAIRDLAAAIPSPLPEEVLR